MCACFNLRVCVIVRVWKRKMSALLLSGSLKCELIFVHQTKQTMTVLFSNWSYEWIKMLNWFFILKNFIKTNLILIWTVCTFVLVFVNAFLRIVNCSPNRFNWPNFLTCIFSEDLRINLFNDFTIILIMVIIHSPFIDSQTHAFHINHLCKILVQSNV